MKPVRPRVRGVFHPDVWRRRDASRDLRDEMELHIALRAESLERAGLTRAEAEVEARRLFALDDETVRRLHESALDRNRYMRTRERWDALWQDLRYAARRLLRDPVTGFIVVTLALGIGINVTAFSVVDRVLLRGPQHVIDPERLFRLYSRVDRPQGGPQTLPWLPYTAFETLRAGLRTIEGMGAYRVDEMMVGSGAGSRMRQVSRTNQEMFALLGVRPLHGRFFGSDEDDVPVTVLGETFWRTALAGDPAVIGKVISIDDKPHTIVGIAPAGFTGAGLGRVDAWTPISPAVRNSQNLLLIGKRRPGVSNAAVAADVAALRVQVEETLPRWAGWLRGATYLAAPIGYDDSARESFEGVMARWLAAISAIILLVSCANVANLLMARLARRRRELAIRIALGAGRGRVTRLMILEGSLLALASAGLGLAILVVVEPVVKGALFPGSGWMLSVIDWRIQIAMLGFALLTALLVSVVPAVQAGREDINDALRGGRNGGATRSRVRSSLTVLQASLSVVLLVGAGLFVRSLQRVNAVDLGMQPDRVLTVDVRYESTPRQTSESFADWLTRTSTLERERYRRLVAIARRVPGVERAAVSVTIPLSGGVSVPLWVPGHDSVPALPGGGPWVTAVGDDYFPTMGTPIREGRAFTATDREGSEPVAIVNETMARVLWPLRSPLGECFHISSRETPCARVVGVAADIHRSGLQEEPSMQYYVPVGQERGFSGSWLVVRPRGAVSTDWVALRQALSDADPGIRSIDVRRLSHAMAGEIRPFRLGVVSFGLSAGLAVIVAGLGLYSIMSHSVAWRRHELGIRLALGARPWSIARLVVRQGAMLAAAGIGFGLVLVLAARPWLQPQLFNTSASDPFVLVGVVVLLELVAILAGWLPARRAVAVDPIEALRAE